MIRRLEHVTHRKKLRELVWSLKKRRLKGSLVIIFNY